MNVIVIDAYDWANRVGDQAATLTLDTRASSPTSSSTC